MITRIVILPVRASEEQDFIKLLTRSFGEVRNSTGCTALTFLRENSPEKNMINYVTYSKWNNESDLENYRQSFFFKNVWPAVKQFLGAKPSAYTLTPLLTEEVKPL